jgi:hypothetical protein
VADYDAEDLLSDAKKRFGADVLENRMRGQVGDANAAEVELGKIASSVVARARSACMGAGIGWPLPGFWPADPGGVDAEAPDPSQADAATDSVAGKPYREVWPQDLLQHALELFNWRTQSGLDRIPDQALRVGQLAEKFFDKLEAGNVSIGTGTPGDIVDSPVLIARNRDGTSNIAGIPDRRTMLDTFTGWGWDL